MFQINWKRYRELEGKKKEDMTKEEWEFYRYMYLVEEYQAGLDGDR